MKTLATAFGISAVIGTILCLVFWGLTGDAHTAGSLAAVPVAAFPQIAAMLEQWQAKKSVAPGQKMMIHTFEGFSISWPIMVVAGTIILVAVTQIGSGFYAIFAAMLTEATQKLDEEKMGAIGLMNFPIVLIGGYLLERWMGARCARNGIGAVVLVAALGAIGNKTIDFIGLSSDDWRTLFGEEKTVANMLLTVIAQFGLFAVIVLLGFWRGRKQKMSKYMHYLLSALPADTTNALVDLAFDEAKKMMNARRANQPYSRP